MWLQLSIMEASIVNFHKDRPTFQYTWVSHVASNAGLEGWTQQPGQTRALSTLRGLRGAPEVPPLCRETQSLGQQMLNAPVGINGLKNLLKPSDVPRVGAAGAVRPGRHKFGGGNLSVSIIGYY